MDQARCGLVVDSGAALPPELARAAVIVPLGLEAGGDVFQEGVDDGDDRLRRALRAGLPVRSSTPSPGEYLAAVRASTAPAVCILTMAASLSAMHQSASVAAGLAASEGDDRPITVVDTGAASLGLGVVARVAAMRCAEGARHDEVVARVHLAAREHTMLGMLGTLAPLARSGRLPAMVAGLGDRLHLHPVFELRGGRGRRLAIGRTVPAAVRQLADRAVERAAGWEGLWMVVFHHDAAAAAADLRGRLERRLPVLRRETVAVPAVAGAYAGSGMVGVALLPLRGAELGPPR